jgi:uncharacterized lipoprotein
MKTVRLVIAALTVALAAACSNIPTGPSAVPADAPSFGGYAGSSG